MGVFSSPDSLVPNVFDPQALNRYGYVLNNPLRYVDPTGQRYCEGPRPEDCAPGNYHTGMTTRQSQEAKLSSYGVRTTGEWSDAGVAAVWAGVVAVAQQIHDTTSHESVTEGFREAFGITSTLPLVFEWDPHCYHCRS